MHRQRDLDVCSSVTLEICVESVEGAMAAVRGGADRLELCQALDEGGVTPCLGLIQEVLHVVPIPVMVMIRPRAGSFVYTPAELDCLAAQIDLAGRAGAQGVVLGVLNDRQEVDVETCHQLVRHARPLAVTFHRAFDELCDPIGAVEQIIRTGCDRILTSGQAPSAVEGLDLIADLVQLARGRISIMPGSGVRPENAREIVQATGVREIHASASSWIHSRRMTSEQTVRGLRAAIDR
jgi:copper homeostasis protein